MMKHIRIFSCVLVFTLMCSACSQQVNTNETVDTSSNTDSNILSTYFSDRDFEIGYDEQNCVNISFNNDSVLVDSDNVSVDDGTITIVKEGTYLLSGTLDSGMVIVNVDDSEKVQLVLDNVNITSPTSAAIYVSNADKVFITTTADSINELHNGGSYVAIDENNIDAVIFAKSDLTLNGAGSLTISSDVEHGIVSKDDLTITSGTYEISVAGHGISGKDAVAIADGTFILTTGKDGIQSDNQDDLSKGYVYLGGGDYTIKSEGDGISASSSLLVDGGTYDIVTAGGYENGETNSNDEIPQDIGNVGRPTISEEDMPTMENQDGNSAMPPEFDMGQKPNREEFMDSSEMMQMTPPEGDFADKQIDPKSDESVDSTVSIEESTSEDKVSTKGLKAGSALTINTGIFELNCVDDGFHSNGDLTFADGVVNVKTAAKAFHADKNMYVQHGEIDIETSYEGLEAQNIFVSGGIVEIYATDDGVNAASDLADKDDILINITAGNLTINAGGDGLDSNGDIEISGGTIFVSSAERGADSPLDYDGSAAITGGIFIGCGSDGMVQNFGDSSTQGSILVSVGNQLAGSSVSINDENGSVLASWESLKSYSNVVISCPELEIGNTYTIQTGESSVDISLDTLIYGNGNIEGMPGGNMGRNPGRNIPMGNN